MATGPTESGPGKHPGKQLVHGVMEALARGMIERRPEVCAKCGQQHIRCSGHHKVKDDQGRVLSLEPCRKWNRPGHSVCFTHGANRNRKQVERKKAETVMQQKMEKAVRALGLPINGLDPQQVLMDEIAWTAGNVRWLRGQLEEMEPNELFWGKASEEHKTGTSEMSGTDEHGEPTGMVDLTTTTSTARPSVVYEMYMRERAHLVHVAKVAIQCGIAERTVKLAEEQGQMIAQAFRSVIESPELQLTMTQITIARSLVSGVLREMATVRQPVLPSPNGQNGDGH